MPHIEHVALWVNDLDRVADFYVRYFQATAGPVYVNASKGFRSRFLVFESGARIELMTTATLSPTQHPPGAQRMGLTHLAISIGSETAVDELTGTLKTAGFSIVDGPRRTGDGYYESVVLDPEGNRVEITA